MAKESYDVVVIGGGPGGYVAAIRAAQLGFKTACVDQRSALGGTCLNVGCIPSKALLQSSHKYVDLLKNMDQYGIEGVKPSLNLPKMMASKDRVVQDLTKGIDYLFRKNKVDRFVGRAEFVESTTLQLSGGQELQSRYFIIATGSAPISLPFLEIDEKYVVSSTGALALASVPKQLAVIGGGVIGLELGSVWSRLGSRVTVVESFDRLVPSLDHEVSEALRKTLESQGMIIKLSTKVTGIQKTPQGLTLFLEGAGGRRTENLGCDICLVAIGRRPYTHGLGLEKIGVKCDAQGFIETNERFATNVSHILAIGDVIRGPMLAHKAEEDGVACVEFLAGQKPHVDYRLVPGVVYTHPEVACVGDTEENLKEKKIPYKVGKFPLSANSRARANQDTEGFIKILAHAQTDEVLGVHMVAPEAGTMIAEAVLAMMYKASAEDIARTCHAHPTFNEAFKEAALAVDKQAIHI